MIHVMSVPLNFVVNTVLYYYCVSTKFNETDITYVSGASKKKFGGKVGFPKSDVIK